MRRMSGFYKSIKQHIFPIGIIITVILIRYYPLFLGADLFLYGDQFVNSSWTYGNSLGNGWRPDKGFGISFFYADPGTWHPWGLLSLWEKLISSRKLAWNSSVVILGILSAIAVYFFIRKVVPQLGRKSCLLAPLIVLCMSQDNIYFSRVIISSLAGVAVMLAILYDYYNKPRWLHFFCLSILFCYVIFLGSFLTFTVLPSMAFVFTILYCIYHKNSLSWKRIFFRYFAIFSAAGIATILLGFWLFYSTFLESSLVGYVKEKNYVFALQLLPGAQAIFQYVLSLLQPYNIPANVLFYGIGWRPLYFSFNVVAIFPLVFLLFLFGRPKTFWEFALKWLLIIFYISQAVILSPVLNSLMGYLARKSAYLFNFYGSSWESFIFPLQIALIGLFLVRVNSEDKIERRGLWGRIIINSLAFIMFIFYLFLTVFSLFALLAPRFFPGLLEIMLKSLPPAFLNKYPIEYLNFALQTNITILQGSMHWHSAIYFMLSAILMLSFIKFDWFVFLSKKHLTFLMGVLLLTQLLFSWTVYPLNNKKTVWEDISGELPKFNPTDRFYYVADAQSFNERRSIDEIKNRMAASGGALKYMQLRGDYHESPSLSLHGVKSFEQRRVSQFIEHIFNADGTQRLPQLRFLYTGGPLLSSPLLDMGAVSYYYSTRELKDIPGNLKLFAKTKWLYIYKNNNAWPYYYLAKNLELKKAGEFLENPKRHTAYLEKEDIFELPKTAGNSHLELKEFSYGKMIFDFNGKNEEFLVIADAWHPLWKAATENKNLTVLKANGIFKGVRLPAGNYSFTFYFDTAAYRLAIYVSLAAWIFFLAGGVFVIKYGL